LRCEISIRITAASGPKAAFSGRPVVPIPDLSKCSKLSNLLDDNAAVPGLYTPFCLASIPSGADAPNGLEKLFTRAAPLFVKYKCDLLIPIEFD